MCWNCKWRHLCFLLCRTGWAVGSWLYFSCFWTPLINTCQNASPIDTFVLCHLWLMTAISMTWWTFVEELFLEPKMSPYLREMFYEWVMSLKVLKGKKGDRMFVQEASERKHCWRGSWLCAFFEQFLLFPLPRSTITVSLGLSYRDSLKGLYMVAIIFFLLLLNSSAWVCLGHGPA